MKVIVLSALVLGFVFLGLEANAQGIGIRAGFQSATTNNNGNQIGGSLDHFYLGAFKNRHLGAGDLSQLLEVFV